MQCTSCGAPLEIRNRFSKAVVCGYCGIHLIITDGGLERALSGTCPKLAEFPSIFRVSAAGTILGKPFAVLGRMRYGYGAGHFDEWFLEYDGAQAWLAEDEGKYTLYTEVNEADGFPDITGVRAGQNIVIGGRKVMVKEKGNAVIEGAEGELSFYAAPGTAVFYMDGISEGKMVSIESSETEVELFTGRPLLKRDIIVTG